MESASTAARGWRQVTAFLPHGWRDFLIQAAAFWIFYAGYEGSRGVVEGVVQVAQANALGVVHAERVLGIYVEPDVQRFTVRTGGVVLWVANWTYFMCQFTISYGLLFWVYFRRNYAYYFVRNVLLLASFTGLVGYITLPTSPPRDFPALGYIDTLHATAVNQQSGIIATFANPYAAMPSLHTAYACVIGTTGFFLCRHWLTRAIWVVYPSLVVFSIVATGNHWLLDAVAGAFVALIAASLALAITRGVLPAPGRPPIGPLVPHDPGRRSLT